MRISNNPNAVMWSASELNTLVAMRVINMSYPECGEVLGRSASELDTLVAMRVINMSYPECGEVLGRSASSCGGAVSTNNLYQIINDLRKERIKEALQNEHCI